MRKGVVVSATALTLLAFLAAPATVLACGGMKTAQHEHGTQTAQTLIPNTTTSTGSAPITPKPEAPAN